MAVEVTDIESQFAPAPAQEEPSVEQEAAPPAVALQRESSVAAPRGRGRPAGSKEKTAPEAPSARRVGRRVGRGGAAKAGDAAVAAAE